MNRSKPWTSEEEQELKKMVKKNITQVEIAKALKRSHVAIEHKMRRMGLAYTYDNWKSQKVPTEPTKPTFNQVINAILKQVKEIPIEIAEVVKAPVIESGTGDKEQAILQITDIHIGRKTLSFDSTVAKIRMIFLIKALLKIITLQRMAGPVKIINVFLTGDMVNSEDVGYRVDLSEIEMILRDQIYGKNGVVGLLNWMFKVLLENFEKVNVYCVRGNHGRGPKGTSEKTNWDDVVYYTLQTKFEDNPRINFTIADSFFLIVKIYNKKFLVAHGDQIRGGTYGLPLYGLLQRMLRWATSMPERWDYLICGHWHVIAEMEQNNQELFVGGTFVSDDDYTLRQYGWNATPKQWFLLIHPRQGITVRRPINLVIASKKVRNSKEV